MNEQTTQLALGQLAILIFSSMVLVSGIAMAFFIAILLSVSLAFSCGSVLALGQRVKARQGDEQIVPAFNAMLATHLGGSLCYVVLLWFALRQIAMTS